MKTTRITVFIASLYLIFKFVGSLSPPTEAQSSSEAALTILFTFGMIVGLVGWLFGQYTNASKTGEKVSAGSVALPVVGLLAGLGLLVSQFGGPRQPALPPRPVTASPAVTPKPTPSSRSPFWSPYNATPTPSASKTQPTTAHYQLVRAQLGLAINGFDRSIEVMQKTRWAQSTETNPFKPAGIRKQDLHDVQQVIRDVIGEVDKILSRLTEFDAATEPLPSEVGEYWKTQRQLYSGVLEVVGLLEDNWSEWSPNGFNPKALDLKPWQKRVFQLQVEVERNFAAVEELGKRIP
jgi:hypothetical protein